MLACIDAWQMIPFTNRLHYDTDYMQMQMSQASSEEFLNSAVAREAISSSSPTDFQVDSRKRKISHHDSISSTSLRMNEMTLE